MATYTSFLNLEKPTTSETFNLLKMNQNWDKIDQGVSSLNSNINNIAFVNHDSKTTYQIPLTGYSQNNYWVALMYAQTGTQNYGVYLIFMNTSDDVIITKIAGPSTITYTGARNGNVIDLTASDTVWGGIRALTMN